MVYFLLSLTKICFLKCHKLPKLVHDLIKINGTREKNESQYVVCQAAVLLS